MEENKSTNDSVEETLTQEVTEETTVEEEVDQVEEEQAEQPEDAVDKSAEYLDRLQRLMAEFDNFRKRSEREKENLYDLGVSSTVTELLSIVDNFERALDQSCEDEKFGAGIQMIYKQLLSVLEKLNVTTIPAAGEEFNPNLHNAIFHIEDESVGENIVVEELQKGYFYKEKVIRHSIVKVAN